MPNIRNYTSILVVIITNMNKIAFCLIIFSLHLHILADSQCGTPNGSIVDGKIVGGYDLGYVKYPWFVALMEDGEPNCGGTLISKNFVVTAAHCFDHYLRPNRDKRASLEKAYEYRLGVYNYCMAESTQQNFKARKVFVHEKYLEKDPYYDIALVKLNKDAVGFEPCCLPSKEMEEDRRPREALITGLGYLKFNDKKSPCTVHEARILMYSDKECRKMLNHADGTGHLLQGAFCAGYLSGGIDGCQGDSGGPLIALGPNSQYYLIGVTSFGFKCAEPKYLGIYTDVSHYLGWLRQTMQEKPSTPSPSGVDWSKYPATPWLPVTITIPPWQTLPPDYDDEVTSKPGGGGGGGGGGNRPVVIIINKKKNNNTKYAQHKHIRHHKP